MTDWTFEGLSLYDITGDDTLTPEDITPEELAECMAGYAFQYEQNREYEEDAENGEFTLTLDDIDFDAIAARFLADY